MSTVADPIQPPDWLNQAYVQKALQEGFRDNSLTVVDYSICPGTGAGDNYVSQIFRATLTISSQTKKNEKLSVIIKSLPKGDAMESMVQECQFFQKETKMLSQTLPKLQKYLDGIGYTHKLSAQMYYKQGPPKDLIFLEDLKVEGYRTADRKTGLDLDHCVLVLESLATLHAGSLALIEHEPEVTKYYNYGFWQEQNEKIFDYVLTGGIVQLADVMETWTDFPRKYADKMRRLESTITKKTCDSFRRNDDRMNVLLHGDTWTNNFMFRYDEGKLKSLKFVDFQLSCYNSPALDLIYFIFSSPTEDIKFKHLDFFLETYHKKFTQVCEELNISDSNFTLKDLKRDFKERLFFAIIVSICVFPVTIAQDADIIDVNEMLESRSSVDEKVYKSQRFQKSIRLAMPYLEENGVI